MNIGNIYSIPVNNETSYMAGVIVGDGHISNAYKSKSNRSKDYRITLEIIDLEFLKTFENLVKSVIQTKSIVRKRSKIKGNRRQLYYFQFRNKSFYYFLTSTLGIPSGNKCSSVIVPKVIFNSLELQKSFLSGLFDTDGGIRGKTIGFTSASQDLISGTSKILDNININYSKDSWTNKKYDRKYYGLRISLRNIDKFLNELHLRNKEKLKKVFRHVAVPEWSNGMDHSK